MDSTRGAESSICLTASMMCPDLIVTAASQTEASNHEWSPGRECISVSQTSRMVSTSAAVTCVSYLGDLDTMRATTSLAGERDNGDLLEPTRMGDVVVPNLFAVVEACV
jgi:hypothetical protein